jgi:hypothetical protein
VTKKKRKTKKKEKKLTDETTVPIEKYREVLSASSRKDAEIQQLKNALKDAEFLLNSIKAEKDSIDKASREEAIDTIVTLSKGKITKDSLKDTPIETINKMAELALNITPPSAITIMRQKEADQNKSHKHPAEQNGPGIYDQTTDKWVGGSMPT